MDPGFTAHFGRASAFRRQDFLKNAVSYGVLISNVSFALRRDIYVYTYSGRFAPDFALVAQGIEHWFPKPCAQVRFLPRAHST